MTVRVEIETTTETLTATVLCIRIPSRQRFFMHLSCPLCPRYRTRAVVVI